jgi:hypothetical protein
MQLSDRLFVYDNESIGQEFSKGNVATIEEARRHADRRHELMRKEWQDTLSVSQSLPKSAVRNMRSFERVCLRSEALISWLATIVIAGIAGLLCALVIWYSHLQ